MVLGSQVRVEVSGQMSKNPQSHHLDAIRVLGMKQEVSRGPDFMVNIDFMVGSHLANWVMA